MDRGTRPWQKVHFDMTFFNKAWNGATCYVHFYCPYSHDHESVILMQKGHIRQAIMIFHQRLTALNLTPDTYHSDMEKSLGNEILPHVTATGVSLDLTAPYTPEQNGPAERAGGVINTIARALRIKALLPADMWPVAIEHATYLVRRRPIRALGWKTPYEMVNGRKPNLGNLRIFGSLAYIKRQNIPRKEKLSPRTEIGYLIGYHASNIYKIWRPGAKKIIQVSRDVSFDEDRIFDPYEPVHLISDKLNDSIEEVKGADDLDIPQPEDGMVEEEGEDIFNVMESVRGHQQEDIGTQEKPGEYQPTFTPEATPPTLSQPHLTTTPMFPPGELTTPNDGQQDSMIPTQQQVLSPGSIQTPNLDEPMEGGNRHTPMPNAWMRTVPSSQQMEGPSINDISQRWDISRTPQYTCHTRGNSTDQSSDPNKYPRWEYDNDIADQQRRRIQANEQRLQLLDTPPQNQRREAYLSDLEQPNELHGFLQAFSTMLTSGLHTSESEPNPTIDAQAFITYGEPRYRREDLPSPPTTWEGMMKMVEPHRTGFYEASFSEWRTILDKGTVGEGKPSHDATILQVKWVWNYKFDKDGWLYKYKARLVIRGDMQRWFTFDDTYAATLSIKVIRALLALAAVYGYQTNQRDVVNAFLNSKVDKKLYIYYPPGMGGTHTKGTCLLLLKALYGLKQAPRLWQKEFSSTLEHLGLRRSSEELCLYQNEYLIIFYFVDDVITLWKKEHQAEYDTFWKRLTGVYDVRDMGELQWFLAMRVIRQKEKRTIYLSQDAYIEKVAKRFHLTTNTKYQTPIPEGTKFEKYNGNASKQSINLYQQKISILYAAITTRPDVSYPVARLSTFMMNPSNDHMELANRVIQYLYSTRYLAIRFGPNSTPFHAASDAAFADNPDRKSTEAYLFKLYGGPIDWIAKKQRTVTTSTTEAELLAVSHASKEMMWWRRLFRDISFSGYGTPTIDCDNRQTVSAMIKDEAIQTRLRHVDIHNHWLRQATRNGDIKIRWIATANMIADGLTKPLNREKHAAFIRQLCLTDIKDLID